MIERRDSMSTLDMMNDLLVQSQSPHVSEAMADRYRRTCNRLLELSSVAKNALKELEDISDGFGVELETTALTIAELKLILSDFEVKGTIHDNK